MNTDTHSTLETVAAVVLCNNFVVLDTETTGLQKGEICQIAVIDHNGNEMLNTLVKSVRPIPPDATRIHRITDHDVKDASGFGKIAPLLRDILAGKDVITYNAVYDRKMLHQSAEAAGIEKIDWKALSPWHCAMEAFAEFYGEWNSYHGNYRWQKLSHAAAYCGIDVRDAHSALGDCLMTLGVLLHMTARVLSGSVSGKDGSLSESISTD